MSYETERMSVMRWVNKFDSVPTKIIAKLVDLEPQKWREVTEPIYGDKVRIKKTGDEGRILEVDRDQLRTVYKINFDGMLLEFRHAFQDSVTFVTNRRNYKTTDFTADEFEVLWGTPLPILPTMWAFTSAADVDWLEKEDGLWEMSDWYFRIFKHDEFGYFFGVDRVSVDMYTDYWQPLFDSRYLGKQPPDDYDDEDEDD